MSNQVRNAAKLLPKPIKPLKRLVPADVVAVIRRDRNFCAVNFSKEVIEDVPRFKSRRHEE